MSLLQRIPFLSALLVGCALLPVSSHAQLSFQPRQAAQVVSNSALVIHGDFNNDGREDLIVNAFDTAKQTYVNQLYLSSADGTYEAPIALPAWVQTIGDFNHDGNLDLVTFAIGGGGPVSIYLGNGDGTFQAPKTFAASSESIFRLLAVDLNHDSKTDLVEVLNPPAGGPPTSMQLWISNGDGTFSEGEHILSGTSSLANDTASDAVVGDFDGDGKPDVALLYGYTVSNSTTVPIPTVVQVWYGDGAGHLASPYLFSDPHKYFDFGPFAADVNNDGRSDIVAAASNPSGSLSTPALAIFTGNSNRTLSYKTLATSECVGDSGTGITVGDFDGDGLNDIVYDGVACQGSSASAEVVVRPGTGSGNFGAEQVVYQNLYQIGLPYTVRTTLGTQPDIAFDQYDGGSNGNLELLTNTSVGTFPGCGLSGFAEGMAICAPGATTASPVKFSIGAAGPTPMRTAAVWVDGKKVAEQLAHAFSNYSFLDTALPLAAGKHSITVFGTGWDDTLQKKSFTLTVGPVSCSAPASPGVHICQPASGATVTSPVVVQAASTIPGKLARMELWLDGVKQYTETSSTTLSTTLNLFPGSFRFTVIAVNTAGTKWEQVVNATVK